MTTPTTSPNGHALGPLHAPGMFEVHDADHRIVADTNPHVLACGETVEISDDLAEEYARLFADAPAAALILRMLVAGVASIEVAEPPGFAPFREFKFGSECYVLTDAYDWTWASIINAIGWQRCLSALGDG